MPNASIHEMQVKLAQHVKAKCKLSRRVLHEQNLILAAERAITKLKHAQTTNIAEAAVVVAEIAMERVTGMSVTADPIETDHDGVDYSRPDEVPESNNTLSGDTVIVTPPPAVTVEVSPPTDANFK